MNKVLLDKYGKELIGMDIFSGEANLSELFCLPSEKGLL